MSGLVDILDAMAEQIRDTLTPLLSATGVDVQVEAGLVASPTPPTIDMYPGDLSRDSDSRMFAADHDGGGYNFTVRARVATNDADGNSGILLALMDDESATSIAQALTDDETLGGLAASLDCVDPSGFRLYDEFGKVLLGFQFTARVLAAHS